MKILVITHEYPPIGGGGGRVVQDLCEGLAARGHQLYVISAYYKGLPCLEKKPGTIIDRIRSFRTQSFRAGLSTMACFIAASIWHGSKVIREWKPDLIHAHFAVPAGAAALALSRLTELPYVITAHGGDVPGGAPQKTSRWFRFVLPFTKPIWKNADRIVSVSEQTRRFARQHYPVEIEVIPNGIDIGRYHPGKFERGKTPLIAYVGRFSPEKNAIAVPEVLSELTDLRWECVMLGNGPQMDRVKASIKNHDMENRFHLPGWVTPEGVQEWLAKSDILFMPSLLDSMPMAGLQGLAMGLALVLSRIGSCPDFIGKEKNGYLVSPGDNHSYAQALRKLLIDKKLLENFRQSSLQHARQFDLQRVITAYEQVYSTVLESRKKCT